MLSARVVSTLILIAAAAVWGLAKRRGYAVLVGAALLGTGCAHARTPDLRPSPPSLIEAHIRASRRVAQPWSEIEFHAWLEDPKAEVYCPGVLWSWPDGTEARRAEECDIQDPITRHFADPQQKRLGPGENLVRVTFDAAGRRWGATTMVIVQ